MALPFGNLFGNLDEMSDDQAPSPQNAPSEPPLAPQQASMHPGRSGAPPTPMMNQNYRSAPSESMRAYSFDLRDIIAVIPPELLAGSLPAQTRLTLQVSMEAWDPGRNLLTVSLGMIARACPPLFSQPVTPANDRWVLLSCPNEGVVSPFRIANQHRNSPEALGQNQQTSATGAPPVGSAPSYPYLQTPTDFGQPAQAPVTDPNFGQPVQAPVSPREGDTLEALRDGTGAQNRGVEPLRDSAFLAAIQQGEAPVEEPMVEAPAPMAEPDGDRLSFGLGELLSYLSRDVLPVDPSALPPQWHVHFDPDFIVNQLPSGRVVATLSQVLENADPVAREALACFAGNEVEVAIPLREVFERLPVAGKEEPPAPAPAPEEEIPVIFSEQGMPGSKPSTGEPNQLPPREIPSVPTMVTEADLVGAPEFTGHAVSEPGPAEDEPDLLDDLEVPAVVIPERDAAIPERAPLEEEVDGLRSTNVPDFSGVGFDSGPPADLELRAIFGTQEVFTPQLAAERTAGLPGVEGVVVFQRGQGVFGEVLPADEEGRQLGRQTGEVFERIRLLAEDLGFAGSEAFTLHMGRGIVSFFAKGDTCVAILHRNKIFEPGVREKLILISRGIASLLDNPAS